METGLSIFGAVICFAAFVFLKVQRSRGNALGALPGVVDWAAGVAGTVLLVIGLWHKLFFYAEPGMIYHVRTIYGQESVVADQVGYKPYVFGYITEWKKAVTVQASEEEVDKGTTVNANLPPQDIIFVDQVPARLAATVRFEMPTDREMFLELAHTFRTQENLLRTTLVPAFKETCRQTGNLMSAEDYYLGARSRFVAEFRNQMESGVYTDVKRVMQVVDELGNVKATATGAAAAALAGASNSRDGKKTIYVVRINKNPETGKPYRKEHDFVKSGVSVQTAIVTDMVPDPLFQDRMKNKMQASSERAIAKEERIKEEEKRKTVEAKGQREIAERKAKMEVDQIEKTTLAETDKKLAIISANKIKEQAHIEREAAAIKLEQAKLDAEAVRVTADANAHAKKALILADGALDKKLATFERVQQSWSEAYAQRQVPRIVFGGGGEGGPAQGTDNDLSRFLKLRSAELIERIGVDLSVPTGGQQ